MQDEGEGIRMVSGIGYIAKHGERVIAVDVSKSELRCFFFFFFNDTATTEIYTLSLHDALPISPFSLPPIKGSLRLPFVTNLLIMMI